MKTTIKSNWLIIVLMALVVCFTAVGVATLRFERGTTVDTPVYAEVLYEGAEGVVDPTLMLDGDNYVPAPVVSTLKYDSSTCNVSYGISKIVSHSARHNRI